MQYLFNSSHLWLAIMTSATLSNTFQYQLYTVQHISSSFLDRSLSFISRFDGLHTLFWTFSFTSWTYTIFEFDTRITIPYSNSLPKFLPIFALF
ncbi:hypothetical protein C8Q75DRAFT_444958 [Abortiporus biennis]|nr:hypothetical protein C8Q75DRAFT_444958 [Abortiporus biennis]